MESCAALKCRPARRTNWANFALANSSDEQIDRLIVVPHYQMSDQRFFGRISAVPRRQYYAQRRATGPIARIAPPPTSSASPRSRHRGHYIMELRTDKLPQVYLWEPDTYKDKVNSFTLYHGIVIGIAGLLALFLTIFLSSRAAHVPAAAALGWAVLCTSGGSISDFWGKVFDMSAARAGMARIRRGYSCGDASRVPFRLSQSQPLARSLRPYRDCVACLPGALVAVALVDPSIASGMARLSLLFVPSRASASSSIGGAGVRPRRLADSDLVPAGVLVIAAGLRSADG